jgi:cytidine deaminase
MDNTQVTEMIGAAKELVDKYTDNKNHTVAAAALTKGGKVITSLNFYHFTGGPCAEVATLARVVSEGEEPLMIVAVGHNNRGVLPPCGRCRQIILDYYPDMQVVVSSDGTLKSIKELLPDTYSWNDQQVA